MVCSANGLFNLSTSDETWICNSYSGLSKSRLYLDQILLWHENLNFVLVGILVKKGLKTTVV